MYAVSVSTGRPGARTLLLDNGRLVLGESGDDMMDEFLVIRQNFPSARLCPITQATLAAWEAIVQGRPHCFDQYDRNQVRDAARRHLYNSYPECQADIAAEQVDRLLDMGVVDFDETNP